MNRSSDAATTGSWFGLYESFAARPFGGNVAGVVISDEGLTGSQMAGLASDIAAPTTGFVARNGVKGQVASVQYFTPTQEIAACGYVAVAVARALYDLGVFCDGELITLNSPAGSLNVESSGPHLTVRQERQVVPDPVSTIGDVAEVLGVRPESLKTGATGLRHLFVRVAAGDMDRLELSHERLRLLGEVNGVDTIGVYAVTGANLVRLRDFTAPIGVLEEPASGTTVGALGLLLGMSTLTVEQGFEMGRPSLIRFRREADCALVSGTVRRVLSGRLD